MTAKTMPKAKTKAKAGRERVYKLLPLDWILLHSDGNLVGAVVTDTPFGQLEVYLRNGWWGSKVVPIDCQDCDSAMKKVEEWYLSKILKALKPVTGKGRKE